VKSRLHCLMAIIFGLAVAEPATAAAPPGWIIAGNAPANYVFAVDAATPVRGSKSASITAKPTATSNGFGTLMQVIAAEDYRGSRLRLSGYLRTAGADRSQMWMRVDGPNHEVLAFDNMDSRPVTGTTGWKRYDIVLDVPQDSTDVAFGYLLVGRGEVWGAGFQLEKVGTAIPVTSRDPILPRKPSNLDFEMDAAPENRQATQSTSFPPIPAGKGRIFLYRIAQSDVDPPAKVKLDGDVIGTATPNQFFFVDAPPGDYTVAAADPGSFSTPSHGHGPGAGGVGTEHALTLHLNLGQVRYIRLDVRWSPSFVTQVYPELVDVAVGRAQIERIKSIWKR
jgi:hypothetical protein